MWLVVTKFNSTVLIFYGASPYSFIFFPESAKLFSHVYVSLFSSFAKETRFSDRPEKDTLNF